VKFTPIRVVCQNTLNMALKGESPLIKIAHTRGVSAKMEEVHKAVEFINTTYKKIEDSFQQWAKTPVDEARLKQYVEVVFPLKDITDQKRIKKIEQYRLEASKLFTDGKGNTDEAVKGTLWAAYNGITEFADFKLVAGTRTQSGRVERLWFGDASKVKELAYDTAAECAANWAKA
jgi:phage/plasmid-like protein (TIGR03299 family)